MPLTVGTAGHVDHGKTWLVRALTGKDTDRLPEEQRRGISIDLGYAPLELPDGRRLSLVDVPGHERFVRTMVAGATGIDLFLLVVDAGEGARPQTREHLAILRAARDRARRRRRHQGRRGRRGDSRAGAGGGAGARPGARRSWRRARRPAKGSTSCGPRWRTRPTGSSNGPPPARPASSSTASFTLRGIGTVVTGTLWSGTVGEGDALRAEPAGLDVRVRSVQVHDRPVERAAAGQRVAVALPGIERTQLRRGDALVEPGAYPLSYRLDVALAPLDGDRRRLTPPRPSRHRRARRQGRPHRRRAGAAAPGLAGGRRPRGPRRPPRGHDARRRDRPRPGAAQAHVGRAPRPARAGRSRLDRARRPLGGRRAAPPAGPRGARAALAGGARRSASRPRSAPGTGT